MVSNSEMCIESNENVRYSGVVNSNAFSREQLWPVVRLIEIRSVGHEVKFIQDNK